MASQSRSVMAMAGGPAALGSPLQAAASTRATVLRMDELEEEIRNCCDTFAIYSRAGKSSKCAATRFARSLASRVVFVVAPGYHGMAVPTLRACCRRC